MDIDFLGLSALISGQVDEKTKDERWDHCKGCTFLTKRDRCVKCGCFMKLKVKFKGASCPIGIWSEDE